MRNFYYKSRRYREIPIQQIPDAPCQFQLAEIGLDNITEILLKILNRKTFDELRTCFRVYLPDHFDRVGWEKVKEVYSTLTYSEWISKTLRLFSIFETDLEQTVRNNQSESLTIFSELISLLFPFLNAKNRRMLAFDLISNIKDKLSNIHQIERAIITGMELNSQSLFAQLAFLDLAIFECNNTIAELRRSQRYRQRTSKVDNYSIIIENINALKEYLTQYTDQRTIRMENQYSFRFLAVILTGIIIELNVLRSDYSESVRYILRIFEIILIFIGCILYYRARKIGIRIPVTLHEFEHIKMRSILNSLRSTHSELTEDPPMPSVTPTDRFEYFNCINLYPMNMNRKKRKIKPLKYFIVSNCRSQIYTVKYSFELMETTIAFDSFNKTTEATTKLLHPSEDLGTFLVGFLNDMRKTDHLQIDGINVMIPKTIIYLPSEVYQALVERRKEKKVMNVFSNCSSNKNLVLKLEETEKGFRDGYRYKIKIGIENFRIYAKAPIIGKITTINDEPQTNVTASLLCFNYIDWHAH